ncbi:EEP domain-containing protein (plasmid) [Rhizobium grahamii]|uniref:EEP domain-containing protein n=1 Tax=Rhizobium grahamii TaxID=1120045 RepID=A0A5Q0CGQ8_9HYPH|nr:MULTISPECIES: endonuclease/exonuclease/phosphatase family protein [Rhizobium]QFY63440.1 EEP domain-containing protein [Rhizobium grahamii]QRM51796.1 EEP domain-containing protein [Rhizobium sp. BG6]
MENELRVLTYNVHSCVGTDRRLDLSRIAEVIANTGAHIVALQELDVGRLRTGGVDQARQIASELRMDAHFHPALTVAEERYGDAILSALPMRLLKAGPLPSVGETRGALLVEIEVSGQKMIVLNTHLGLRAGERVTQVATLLGDDWLGNTDLAESPVIVCGDFNAVPSSTAYKMLARRFIDARSVPGTRQRATYPSRMPFLRIDHVFVSEGIKVRTVNVANGARERRASDHLPLLVTLEAVG